MKHKIYYMIILTIIILTISTQSMAQQKLETQDSVSIEKNRINVEESIFANKKLLEAEIAGEYDLRDDLGRIDIKNQGASQACWAYSTLSTLETHLLKVNGEAWNFSENHMNYSTCNEFLKTEDNPSGTNPLGYNRDIKTGANAIVAMSYMTRGSGPIKEIDVNIPNDESKIDISELYGKEVQKKIEDYIMFPSISKERRNNQIIYKNETTQEEYTYEEVLEVRADMKKHIITYGGLAAMTMSGAQYNEYYNYNATKNGQIYPAYYCDNNSLIKSPNHQITLVGWDDNYSKDNFNR